MVSGWGFGSRGEVLVPGCEGVADAAVKLSATARVQNNRYCVWKPSSQAHQKHRRIIELLNLTSQPFHSSESPVRAMQGSNSHKSGPIVRFYPVYHQFHAEIEKQLHGVMMGDSVGC